MEAKTGRWWGYIRLTLEAWLHVLLFTVAGAGFAAALLAPTSTVDNPAEGAGIYAPVIALCVGVAFLVDGIATRRMKRPRPLVTVLLALGMMASAYLWLAGEAEVHPMHPGLAFEVGFLFAAASLGTTLLVGSVALNWIAFKEDRVR